MALTASSTMNNFNRIHPGSERGFSAGSILWVIAALVFSMADAGLTLRLISGGAQELNPILDFYLRLGPQAFVAFKYLLTTSGVLFLLVHQDHGFLGGLVRGRSCLVAIPVLYLISISYQAVLLTT